MSYEFIKKTKKKEIANIIEKAKEETQVFIIDNIPLPHVIDIIAYMSNDELADILINLSRKKRKEILQKMNQKKRNILLKLMEYSEETAGGLMTTEYLAFQENLTVEEIINKMEVNLESKTANLETIYVLDKNNKLVGKADLRQILSSPKKTMLKNITN